MSLRRLLWCGISLFPLVACGSSDEPEVFLGPLQAAPSTIPSPPTPPSPSCSTPEIPALDMLPVTLCPSSLSGTTPLGLAASSAGLLIVSGEEVRAFDLDAAGCPGTPIGESVQVPSTTGPVAFSDRLWLAGASSVQIWNGNTQEGSCALAGARSLVVSGQGVLAVTGGGVRRLEVSGQECSVGEPWSLSGSPLAACASFGEGAWVAVTQSGTCSAAPVVSRYNSEGAVDEGAPVLEATRLGLCTVSALAEVGDQLVLLDGACKRGAVVNATSGKAKLRWEAPTGQTPVGIIPVSGGALLVTASGPNSSATLRFFQLAF